MAWAYAARSAWSVTLHRGAYMRRCPGQAQGEGCWGGGGAGASPQALGATPWGWVPHHEAVGAWAGGPHHRLLAAPSGGEHLVPTGHPYGGGLCCR